MKLYYFTISFVYTAPAQPRLIQTGKYLNSHSKLLDNTVSILKQVLIRSNNTRIDISNLPRGLYFIKLLDGLLLKFIK